MPSRVVSLVKVLEFCIQNIPSLSKVVRTSEIEIYENFHNDRRSKTILSYAKIWKKENFVKREARRSYNWFKRT